MIISQWHVNVQFGKQKDALRIMKEWYADGVRHSNFKNTGNSRFITGYIGNSPSELIHEIEFDTVADWEASVEAMMTPQFEKYAKELAPIIVPGSHHWTVMKVVE